MIQTQTVLILGAGASVQYGFPTGRELTKDIIQLMPQSDFTSMNGRKPLTKILKETGFQPNDIQTFATALNRSAVYSIDEFLESRTEFIPLGKAAIAAYLLPCETENSLFWSSDSESWYQYLFAQMRSSPDGGSLDFDLFSSNKISFITFNYDRSLEMFLLNALKHFYGKSDDEAAAKLKEIKIIHVHGSLGELIQLSPEGMPYGNEENEYDKIKRAASSIKIIHESADNDREFRLAKILIKNADKIFFLGFGYNRMSMQRLGIDQIKKTPDIYGTALGLTDLEITKITYVNQVTLKSYSFVKAGIIELFRSYGALE